MAALMLACGPGPATDTPVPWTPAPITEAPGTATPSPFDREGRFAMMRVVALKVANPDTQHIVTDPDEDFFTQQTFTWLVGSWLPTGEGALLTEEVCFIEVSVIGGIDTLISDALVAGLTPLTIEASLTSPEVGAPFWTPPYGDVWGADLIDPVDDPLPTDPTDPQVWDQDKDGEPGVTILLWIVELDRAFGTAYVAQRVVFSMEGRVQSPDEVAGAVTVHSADQVVLDGEPAYVAANEPEVYPEPDPSLSYFRAIRVDPDFGCEQLRQSSVREQLFPLP